MERLRGLRLKRAGLIAALAILPLMPLVTSVVYRLTFGPDLPSSIGIGAYLASHTSIWTALFVAFSVALVPAGLILMRRPDASASLTVGTITIALGLIGVAYAATRLVLFLPDVSPRWIRLVVALSLVPAAAGILVLRKREISGVRALGISTIALGVIGAVYYLPEIPTVLTLNAQLWDLAAWFASAIAMTIVPLIVGIGLIRIKGISDVKALGIVVIMLGVIGILYRANVLLAYVMNFNQWHPSIVVALSVVAALVVAPTIAGILMIRMNELSVASAIGLTAIALGVIGATHSASQLTSILLLSQGTLFAYAILITIIIFVPLIAALGLVPSIAGVVLMRRAHASSVWALGLMAIVAGVVGTTFSAAQLVVSGPPSLFSMSVGIHLLNTAWLP